MAAQMPACAAAPGIPQTTLEASSWAITFPPAATISLPPRIPSEPMPVSTTARTPPCKPAVDPLFISAIDVWQGGVLAVVLTGMGSDGMRGGKEIVAAGGNVIAQD